MNSNLQLISTRGWTDEQWLAYRMNGIGGSEVGAVMKHSEYKSRLQLHLEKTGQWVTNREEKISTYMGKRLEDFIADEWQYWTTDQMSVIQNRQKEDFKIRKCRRINGYVVNPKYPWLFASLDRLINKNQVNLLTEEMNPEEGVLEIKTISSWEASKWESEIPTSYIMQLQTYLTVFDLEYGEIALLKDGRFMEVIPFKKEPSLIEEIIDKTHDFWQNILQVREFLAQKQILIQKSAGEDDLAQVEYEIARREPEPDETGAYKEFMKERFANPVTNSKLQGNMDHVKAMLEREQLKLSLKEIEAEVNLRENKVKAFMGNTEIMDCGEYGRITWKADTRGIRSFRPSIKQLQENG